MAERFDYPLTGSILASFVPSIDRDYDQSDETYNDGVLAEPSSGNTEYRYSEGIRTKIHRLGYIKNSDTDKAAFLGFKDLVGGEKFRFTDWQGLIRKVSFASYQTQLKAYGTRWSWECQLREEDPPPGLERVPSNLYPDLSFYLRAYRSLTAYGRGDVTASFSRASSASFTDPFDGLIKTAAANVARFEVNGLLLEGSRTNLCLRSDDFSNATWAKTNVSVAANDSGSTDPAGGFNADLLTASAGNGTVLQVFTIASASKVFTLYLKRKTGSGNIDISVDNGSTWTTVSISASAWTRVVKVQTLANPTIGVRIVTNADAVWAWGAQLEDGVSFASSYIATTTASVTRGADLLTFPSTDNLSGTAGTLIAVFIPAGMDDAVIQNPLSLDDGSANERVALLTSSSSALRPRAKVTDGGVDQADIIVGGGIDDFALATKKSIGITWQLNDVHLYTTGIDRGSDSGATMPTLSAIRLGSGPGGADPVFGWLRDIAIFSRALSGAEFLTVHQGII